MNLVLAHGILGFKTCLGVDYFNGVRQHLESKFKAKILVTEVDPVNGIRDRGLKLSKQILIAFGETGMGWKEEVGHNIDRGKTGKPKHFDYLRRYEELVEHLRSIK